MKKEKNIEWVLRAEEEDVYFIFDDERWKRKKICNKAYFQLLFVGHEHFPVIKIFISLFYTDFIARDSSYFE